jgi:hypothetical protein
VIRLLLRLYPRDWRHRYGDELADLTSATGMSARAVVDLIIGALREHLRFVRRRTAGGPPMDDRADWASTALAIFAMATLVPTLLFMSFFVLIHMVGIPGEQLRPIIEPAVAIVPVGVGFGILPFVALALAVVPLLRMQVRRDGRALHARVALRPLGSRRLNAGVALLAAAAVVILGINEVFARLL